MPIGTEVRRASRQTLRDCRDALVRAGMDADCWAENIIELARGWRELTDVDRERMDASDSPRRGRKPNVMTLTNGREVVLIETRTRLQALKLIAEVYGWASGGIHVNVNTGEGGVAGDVNVTLAQVVARLDQPRNQRLADALAAMPEDVRRELAEATLLDAEAVTAELTDASMPTDAGRLDPDHANEP